MYIEPINGFSTYSLSANYGQSIKPVKEAKKVDFSDAMVVPVGENNKEQAGVDAVAATRTNAVKMESAFNQVASRFQGQNSFYDASMQGGSYAVLGSGFDAIA